MAYYNPKGHLLMKFFVVLEIYISSVQTVGKGVRIPIYCCLLFDEFLLNISACVCMYVYAFG